MHRKRCVLQRCTSTVLNLCNAEHRWGSDAFASSQFVSGGRLRGAALQVDKTFLSKLPVLGHGKAVYHLVHADRYHKDKAVSSTAIFEGLFLGLLRCLQISLRLLELTKCLSKSLRPLRHCLQAVSIAVTRQKVMHGGNVLATTWF